MIQSKMLISVLIMGLMTTACNSGGSGGGGSKAAPGVRPNNLGNGSGQPPLANQQFQASNNNNNGTKTVGMTVTPSGAALPGTTSGTSRGGDPAIDNLDLSQPLTKETYSAGYYDADQPLTPTSAPQPPAVTPSQTPVPQPPVAVAPPAAATPPPAPEAQPTAQPATGDATVPPSTDSQATATTIPTVPLADPNAVQPAVPPAAAPVAAPVAAQAPPPSPFSLEATEDPLWKPGLPRKPVTDRAHQIITDPNSSAELYTDSKEDYMMAHLLTKLNGDKLIEADRTFAKQITGVNVSRIKDSFTVTAQIFEDGEKTPKKVKLEGRLNNPETVAKKENKQRYFLHNERKALLEVTKDTKANYHYLAHLICWDQNKDTCESSSIEIVREKTTTATKKAKTESRAFVIYRIGAADLTIASEGSESNPNHEQFDKYLLNSVINSCVQKKAKSSAEDKATLEQICPGTALIDGGARHILVKSWAVALGQAKFALIFQNDDSTTQEFKKALVIRGELKISQSPVPMKVAQTAAKSDKRESEKWFAHADAAELMVNDGAGDMNVHLRFAGTPAEESRFSISTNFETTVEPGDVAKLKAQGTSLDANKPPATATPPAATPAPTTPQAGGTASPIAVPGPVPKISTAEAQ